MKRNNDAACAYSDGQRCDTPLIAMIAPTPGRFACPGRAPFFLRGGSTRAVVAFTLTQFSREPRVWRQQRPPPQSAG